MLGHDEARRGLLFVKSQQGWEQYAVRKDAVKPCVAYITSQAMVRLQAGHNQ